MNNFLSQAKLFLMDEGGASAVEYGVLVALIIVVCVAMIELVGQKLNNTFNSVANALP